MPHRPSRFEHRLLARALVTAWTLAWASSAASLDDEAAAATRAATQPFPEFGHVLQAQRRHLVVDGVDRDYLVQPVREGASRAPVVVLLHGGTQTAEAVWRETSLPTLGQREGFIVVAPQAIGKQWNDARGATLSGAPASTADDVRFLKGVIAEVEAQDHGDPSAIFMVGVSNGGFMTMRFACDAGEVLRAAAASLSTLPEPMAQGCRSPRPLPWLQINGTDDPIVPFGGQTASQAQHGQVEPALRSADETFRFWADRAGCTGPVTRHRLTDPARDERGRWAESIVRSGCVSAQVSEQVVLHGSGHALAGLSLRSRLVEHVLGPGAPEIDGGTLIWDYFKATLMK